MTRLITTIDRTLHLIETTFLTLCFVCMVGALFAQVMIQTWFGGAAAWTQEVSQYLMVWLMCFGASAATRAGRHIALELLSRTLGPVRQRRVALFVWTLSAATCVGGAIIGVMYVVDTLHTGAVSPALGIPLWAIYTALPAAAAMMAVRFLLLLTDRLLNPDKGGDAA